MSQPRTKPTIKKRNIIIITKRSILSKTIDNQRNYFKSQYLKKNANIINIKHNIVIIERMLSFINL